VEGGGSICVCVYVCVCASRSWWSVEEMSHFHFEYMSHGPQCEHMAYCDTQRGVV